MDRRDVLKLLASAAALPALSPEAFSLFRSVHAQIAQVPGPTKLNPHQDATVAAIAEMIIPETDTPGAKGVKVNEFIALILADWFDEVEASRFIAGLADVDEHSQKLFAKNFIDGTEEQRNQILSALDEEAVSFGKEDAALNNRNRSDAFASAPFFRMMKTLTLTGYYTSEVGFEEELHASIIPPDHAGCVPLPAEVAK